jgi:hypothetical protein
MIATAGMAKETRSVANVIYAYHPECNVTEAAKEKKYTPLIATAET